MTEYAEPTYVYYQYMLERPYTIGDDQNITTNCISMIRNIFGSKIVAREPDSPVQFENAGD